MGPRRGCGHVAPWKPLNLSIGGRNGAATPWSPDSASIVYTAVRDDTGQRGAVVIVRNLASGQEREIYRDSGQVWCYWTPDPDLTCVRFPDGSQTTDFFTCARLRTRRADGDPAGDRLRRPWAWQGWPDFLAV